MELRDSLENHAAIHPGEAPDYQLIDSMGKTMDESKDTQLLKEKDMMDRFAEYAQ